MSLINDVLRDLDARRASDLASPDLQREIRSLPETSRTALPVKLVFGLVLILGGAAGVWYFLPALTSGKAEAPLAVQPALVPVQPPLETTGADSEPALRTATSLAAPPLPKEPVKPRVPDESDKPRSLPVPEATKMAQPTAVRGKLAESVTPAAAGQVEKKPSLASPRERAEAELLSAQNLLAQDRGNEALEHLRSALRHDPAYSPARQLWLKALLEQKRFDEAGSVLQDGLELQPNQIGWAMTLARLQMERNDVAAAERTLARSFGYGAGNAAYLGFYGHVRNRLAQHREAIELYQGATKLAPGEGRWWFGLATALEGAGRAAEARDAYRQALGAGNLPSELAAIAEQKQAR